MKNQLHFKSGVGSLTKGAQTGFTLLELILAMSLTALLLGMLSAGVYSVVNDWERETSVLDEALDKSLVLVQIERSIFSAFPHSYVDPERVARFIYFEGRPESMSWVSTVAPSRTSGVMAWRLESDFQEGVQLKLVSAFSDNPDVRFALVEPETILPGYTAQFRYLIQRNEDEKEWLDEWAGSEYQSLPLAVYILLTPRDEEVDRPLEILTSIKTWRHEEIPPTIPVI